MTDDTPPSHALPARALPEGIRRETLEAEAKELLKAAKDAAPAALHRIEPDRPSSLTLRQAERVVARGYGFDNWGKLMSYLKARDDLLEAERELEAVQKHMKPSEDLANQLDAAQNRAELLLDRLHTASDTDAPALCSFCRMPLYGVRKLFAGPDATICDECVDLCREILKGAVNEGESHDR